MARCHSFFFYINRTYVQFLYTVLLLRNHSWYRNGYRSVHRGPPFAWGAEPRFELVSALQQAEAILSELCRTIAELRRNIWATPHPKTFHMYITVMEYLDGGELFERVATEDFTLTESDCCLFLRQICRGVQYLHTRNIVHLDLKVMWTKNTLLHIAFLKKI